MEAYNFCQSCGMPLNDPLVHGTEKNGDCSLQYCIYRYKDGQFTHPEMTLEEMQYNERRILEQQHLHGDVINAAVNSVQFLNRWLQRNLCRLELNTADYEKD